VKYAIAIATAIFLLALGTGGAISPPADALEPAAAAQAGTFVATDGSRSFASAPGIREWTYTLARGDSSPFDRIGLHRVTRGAQPPAHPELVMLYLPGTNMNGEVAVADPRYSLPLFMASHGIDFWALDYRTHFIPPATPAANLVELKGWTNESFESDIEVAAGYVMKTTGRPRIFVAGFSRGVSFAYLFAARHPQKVEGLVIFDGWIPPDRPAAVAPPPTRYADDIGGAHLTYDKRKVLMDAVIANPDGPAPLAKYKSARANLEAVVYGAGGAFGGHGGLANPGGGFSDAVVLARMLAGYDRYWPTVQDHENSFTPADRARLAASKISVIAFSSTNIGAHWPQQVAQSAGYGQYRRHGEDARGMGSFGCDLRNPCGGGGLHAHAGIYQAAASEVGGRAGFSG
jgi:pimeloyl-ACP methyl ester carboxylesterase